MFNKNAFTTTYPFISIIQQELLSQGGWKGNVTEVVRFKHCNKKKNHPLKGARYTSSNFKGLGVGWGGLRSRGDSGGKVKLGWTNQYERRGVQGHQSLSAVVVPVSPLAPVGV